MKKTYNRGFIFLVPAIIIGVVALLGGTVATAQVSLPGSPLYGIKTATESVRVALAFTNKSKAKTHLSIAKEKVSEIEALSTKVTSADIFEQTESRFADHQSKARGHIEIEGNGSDVAQLNKSLDEIGARNQAVLNVVLTQVPEQAKAGIQNALDRSQKGHNTALEAVGGERPTTPNGNATSSLQNGKPAPSTEATQGQSGLNRPETTGRPQ